MKYSCNHWSWFLFCDVLIAVRWFSNPCILLFECIKSRTKLKEKVPYGCHLIYDKTLFLLWFIKPSFDTQVVNPNGIVNLTWIGSFCYFFGIQVFCITAARFVLSFICPVSRQVVWLNLLSPRNFTVCLISLLILSV